jgi:hypothetical protein
MPAELLLLCASVEVPEDIPVAVLEAQFRQREIELDPTVGTNECR